MACAKNSRATNGNAKCLLMNTPEPRTSVTSGAVLGIPVLEIENLAVAYKVPGGEIEAIHDVSFAIARGETYGLVGESGCGKSTTAWAVVDFLGANGYVKRGRIRFEGQDLLGRSPAELLRLRGNRIAMVYQDPMQSLNPSLCLGDQMKEVLTVHRGLSDTAATRRCLEMLERVYMPDPVAVFRRYPHQVSGGQQQRVVIAMALLNNPALLIMDEPTTSLDVTVEAAVLDLVAELRRDFDTAILFISHNLGVIARVCDRVGVMYAGELAEQATTRDLFARPRHPYTQGLIRCLPRIDLGKGGAVLQPIRGRVPAPGDRPAGCVFHPRCDYARERCRVERPALRPLAGDVHVRCHFAEEIDPVLWNPATVAVAHPDPLTENTPAVLAASGLQKYYPVPATSLRQALGMDKKRYVRALEDATFDVQKGRTLGVVGESGCGKSTLLRTLIGLESSSGGAAEYIGFDLTRHLNQRDSRLIQELQMVFQNPDATMNPAHTVGYQIGRPMQRFGTVPKGRVRDEVVRLLEAVRLSAVYYDRLPGQLSGGEKQRVAIARAFASRPGLVLCDEPVSSLDVSVQAALLNLLLGVQAEYGTTMIFVAHDLSVVRYLSDQVAVMYLGEIVEIGPTDAIYAPPYHPYTEALLAAVPVPDPDTRARYIRLPGTVPSAIERLAGCPFHTRCPRRVLLPDGGRVCEVEKPPWRDAGDGHRILCHIPLATLRALDPVIARADVAVPDSPAQS